MKTIIDLMEKLVLSPKDSKKIRSEIKAGIRRKVREAGAKGVVVGLSGGIDSSLVAILAKEAGVDVYGLVLPESASSGGSDASDAVNLAEKFKIKYGSLELDRVLTSIRNDFQWSGFKRNRMKSWGNVKARVRMTLLYLTANLDKRIVLGTGNRTELMLGYFTKYGDGGVDYLPIGGLYKTQVRQLAKYAGVPEAICRKTPTAGLWPGQTDEGELGLKYRQIDEILHSLLDQKLSVKETARKTKLPESAVRKIKRKIAESSHKRTMPEICALL
jgi:NAD+ synthase